MDQPTNESRPQTSETFEQKVERLERNFRRNSLITLNRAFLTDRLEFAYECYSKSFHQDNKIDALIWDAIIRTIHSVIDNEVTND